MQLVIEELGFKLVPHQEGFCYQLFGWKPMRVAAKGRYRGHVVGAGWVSTGHYPATVSQGVALMLNLAVNSDSAVVTSVGEAAQRIERACGAVLAAVWSDPNELPPMSAHVSTGAVTPLPLV